MTLRKISAMVAQPNTPETDAQRVVDHIVNFEYDGKPQRMVVLATDPMAAIETVKRLFAEG